MGGEPAVCKRGEQLPGNLLGSLPQLLQPQPPAQSPGCLSRCLSPSSPVTEAESIASLVPNSHLWKGKAARPLGVGGEASGPALVVVPWGAPPPLGRVGGAATHPGWKSCGDCSLVSCPRPGFSIDSGKGLVRAEELSFVAGAPVPTTRVLWSFCAKTAPVAWCPRFCCLGSA